jgi:hypothetical protein
LCTRAEGDREQWERTAERMCGSGSRAKNTIEAETRCKHFHQQLRSPQHQHHMSELEQERPAAERSAPAAAAADNQAAMEEERHDASSEREPIVTQAAAEKKVSAAGGDKAAAAAASQKESEAAKAAKMYADVMQGGVEKLTFFLAALKRDSRAPPHGTSCCCWASWSSWSAPCLSVCSLSFHIYDLELIWTWSLTSAQISPLRRRPTRIPTRISHPLPSTISAMAPVWHTRPGVLADAWSQLFLYVSAELAIRSSLGWTDLPMAKQRCL